MELVAAGSQHDADLSAAIASEGGVVGAGQDLEFAHGIQGRADRRAIELGVAVIDAVEQEAVRVLARAVDVDGEGAAYGGSGAYRGRHHAGQQQAELVEIAAIERQPLRSEEHTSELQS